LILSQTLLYDLLYGREPVENSSNNDAKHSKLTFLFTARDGSDTSLLIWLTCCFCNDRRSSLHRLSPRKGHFRLHKAETALSDDRRVHPSHQTRHTNFRAKRGWYALLSLRNVNRRSTVLGQPFEGVSPEEVPYMRSVSVTYEMTALAAVTVHTPLHTALAVDFAAPHLCGV
jgi:hypothetical protein